MKQVGYRGAFVLALTIFCSCGLAWGGGNIFPHEGNVGIGTTRPPSDLSVFSNTPNQSVGMVDVRVTQPFRGTHRPLSFWKRNQHDNAWLHWTFELSSGDHPNLRIWRAFRPRRGRSSFEFPLTLGWNGNVGIGTTHPQADLDVIGEVMALGFRIVSDTRLKTDVQPLTDVLAKLEELHGMSFRWNEEAEAMGRASDRREIGLMAQDVEAVFPELVTTWGEKPYKALDYTQLTGVLVEAVKELRAEKNAEIQVLRAEKDAQIAALEARLAALERTVGAPHTRHVMASSVLSVNGLVWSGLVMAGLLLGWRFRFGR